MNAAGSTPTFGGVADGASTQWRARAKNALGWSPWSGWASFARVAWKTLTITSPGATSEDPSPVVQATYGGTVTAWQAVTRNASGGLVESSGWQPGSALSYGTTRSVGASGTAYMQIRDDVQRVSTPGDPDVLTVAQPFTVSASGTAAAFTSVVASQVQPGPEVYLTAQRSQVPDQVAVYRDSGAGPVLVARVNGADTFAGQTFSFVDYTAPMNTSATYTVAAIANGAWSAPAAAAAITPRCVGRWLIDPTNGAWAWILGGDDDEQTQPEVAVVHTPLTGFDGPLKVVRRRLARSPRQGSTSGDAR